MECVLTGCCIGQQRFTNKDEGGFMRCFSGILQDFVNLGILKDFVDLVKNVFNSGIVNLVKNASKILGLIAG